MTLKELEERLSSHFLFIYNNLNEQENAIIDPDMLPEISNKIKNMNNYDSITIVLNTRGGNLASGYKIINMIKEKFSKVDVFVIGRCGSTGTFMALAADNLYTSNYAMITPTEPQMEICDGTNQSISISIVREFLDNISKYPECIRSLDPITFGNYCATISYFKNLCYNTYDKDKARKITEFMLNRVNSHQYPLNKSDFKEMGITLLDIPKEIELFIELEHNQIVKFLADRSTTSIRYTVIRSKEETTVYEKKYSKDKSKIAEGYFIIKEEEFMKKTVEKNGRVTDIMSESEKSTKETTYKDAYSDRHWDSYNDSYYHDKYNDRYADYGDNSMYHDSYRDGAVVDKPKVMIKNPQETK